MFIYCIQLPGNFLGWNYDSLYMSFFLSFRKYWNIAKKKKKKGSQLRQEVLEELRIYVPFHWLLQVM